MSKDKISTLLTIASAVGVVATSLLTGWGVAKAIDTIEKNPEECKKPLGTVKKTGKYFLPAIASGVATVGCIFASKSYNDHRVAILASTAITSTQLYNDYSGKVKELYGEEAHQKVIDAIADEKASPVYLTAGSIGGSTTLDVDLADDKERLFYDSFSKRYFTSTFGKVLQAEYHLNRNYTLGGNVNVNMFYEFLGISQIDDGDELGWDYSEGICWIDFMHWVKQVNGEDCIVIDMEFSPMIPDENY